MQLIELVFSAQVGSLAAHVGNGREGILEDIVLDVEVPLLHIWPDCLSGNGDDIKREQQPRGTADVSVPGNVELSGSLHQRWRTFQRFGIGFVPVGVLEKYAVSAADRGFPIALGIEG